jgi:hypothetical protein
MMRSFKEKREQSTAENVERKGGPAAYIREQSIRTPKE